MFQATLSPLLFLAAMGLGLGDLVNKGSGGVDGVDYLVFVTPGLMAASAMMQASGESLWPVLVGREVAADLPRRGVDAGGRAVGLRRAGSSGRACG